MKRLFISFSVLVLVSTSSVFAQFEGIIEFNKIKTETTKYSYAVKGNKVRVEETSPDGSLKGIMLVDLANETVTALSPERKLYMDATNKRIPPPSKTEVNKTTNKKTFEGLECSEWVVSSTAEGTEISYWVLPGNDFEFFDKLLRVINRKDKLSKYFLSIPNHENRFTMAAIEKDMEGNVKAELRVTSLKRKTIDASVFEIPKDYQKFER